MKENIKDLYTVAFYNLENLFDTIDDPNTLDDDFTPKGRKKWNEKRYTRKLKKLGSVISQIGTEDTDRPPILVGVSEVENDTVLKDLIATKELEPYNYDIVHYDSKDERGIEVGLIYQKEHFEVINSEAFSLLLYNDEGERDYTRDILLVKGKLRGELIYALVNHWPSRRKGTQETEYKRIEAAKKNHKIIEEIYKETTAAKVLILGDFNDNPNSPSLKHHLVSEQFYNPFESLFDKGRGTATHERAWHLFDQIVVSRNFFIEQEGLVYRSAEIFDEHFLKQWKGKRKGSPFRTYIGKWYQGGISDHFPVYITLEFVKF